MAIEKLAEVLRAQQHAVARARSLLEQAGETLNQREPAETFEDTAQRIRGVAVVVSTALSELWISVGWFELAHEAEIVLDE
jgi:hypothetical protein